MRSFRRIFILSISLFFLQSAFAYNEPPRFSIAKKNNSPRMRSRVYIAPVVSSYKINRNHASSPRQKMSGAIGIKEEVRLSEAHNFFFLFGIEYMVHGLNFNSYYFKKDSIQLYTGEFNSTYNLYLHEVDIPIQMKVSFNRENNSLYSPYIMLGYHFRTMLAGNLNVKQNGESIDKRVEKITFKNSLFNERCNTFISLTLGVQKNNPNTQRKCIFAELNYRWGFSPYLLTDHFTPSSLYINGNHLSICLGIKF
jgi:hypothetical protein